MMVYLVLTCIVMVMARGLFHYLCENRVLCFMYVCLTFKSFCRHLHATMKQEELDDAAGSNGSVSGFPPNRPSYSCIKMSGNEVFRFAVRAVPQSIEYALQNAGLTGSSIDWLLLHQV